MKLRSLMLTGLVAAGFLAAPLAKAADPSNASSGKPAQAAAEPDGATKPVSYKPPLVGAPSGRVGGGTRALAKLQTPTPLAPGHVGLASGDQPVLYWFLPAPGSEALLFSLKMAGETTGFTRTLAAPQQAGLQRLDLAVLGARLLPGAEYAWTLTPINESGQTANRPGWGGGVKFVKPAPALTRQLRRQGAKDQAAVYAENGYWYDSVALLCGQIERAPEAAAPRARLANLLDQVGLSIPLESPPR